MREEEECSNNTSFIKFQNTPHNLYNIYKFILLCHKFFPCELSKTYMLSLCAQQSHADCSFLSSLEKGEIAEHSHHNIKCTTQKKSIDLAKSQCKVRSMSSCGNICDFVCVYVLYMYIHIHLCACRCTHMWTHVEFKDQQCVFSFVALT